MIAVRASLDDICAGTAERVVLAVAAVDRIDAAFTQQRVLSVVARDATILIRCPSGVRPLRVLGREARIEGQTVHASLGQLFRGQERYLILEVELPAARPGRRNGAAVGRSRRAER